MSFIIFKGISNSIIVDSPFLALFRLAIEEFERSVRSLRLGAVALVALKQHHDATFCDVAAAFELLPGDPPGI